MDASSFKCILRTFIYTYIYVCVCDGVCACVCVCAPISRHTD